MMFHINLKMILFLVALFIIKIRFPKRIPISTTKIGINKSNEWITVMEIGNSRNV